MRVKVHPDNCIMSANCLFQAPRVFTQDDDGVVSLLTEDPAEDDKPKVLEAARQCPGAAIVVE